MTSLFPQMMPCLSMHAETGYHNLHSSIAAEAPSQENYIKQKSPVSTHQKCAEGGERNTAAFSCKSAPLLMIWLVFHVCCPWSWMVGESSSSIYYSPAKQPPQGNLHIRLLKAVKYNRYIQNAKKYRLVYWKVGALQPTAACKQSFVWLTSAFKKDILFCCEF